MHELGNLHPLATKGDIWGAADVPSHCDRRVIQHNYMYAEFSAPPPLSCAAGPHTHHQGRTLLPLPKLALTQPLSVYDRASRTRILDCESRSILTPPLQSCRMPHPRLQNHTVETLFCSCSIRSAWAVSRPQQKHILGGVHPATPSDTPCPRRSLPTTAWTGTSLVCCSPSLSHLWLDWRPASGQAFSMLRDHGPVGGLFQPRPHPAAR